MCAYSLNNSQQMETEIDMQNWTVNDIPPQTGKLAIVTGAEKRTVGAGSECQ